MNGDLECGVQIPKSKGQQEGQPGTGFKLNTVQGLNARDLAKEQRQPASVGVRCHSLSDLLHKPAPCILISALISSALSHPSVLKASQRWAILFTKVAPWVLRLFLEPEI